MQRGVVSRWLVRFHAGDGWLKRTTIRLAYYVFIILPYPLRRVASAIYILQALALKKLLGVERQTELTPLEEVGTLSFWGVPSVDVHSTTLIIDGEVEHSLDLRFDQLLELPAVERTVRMDCVGGFRNNTKMKGVSIAHLFDLAKVRTTAQRAIFYCSDGYYSSIPVADLIQHEAFLAYSVNGEHVPKLGYPLRLAIPGKYGYKWPKWIERVELTDSERKGYWESRGLPDRANMGDIW